MYFKHVTVGAKNGTFLDEIYSVIKNNDDISDKIASRLKRFCDDNEYETESIEDDVWDVTSSNISENLRSSECIDAIQQCFQNLKCMLWLYVLYITFLPHK